MIEINVETQELIWSNRSGLVLKFAVSTAAKGTGQQSGSFQTPLGRHQVSAKIGQGLPLNAVFRGRRWTGEIYSDHLAELHPNRDWILSRILWLKGCEPGFNQGRGCDSRRRYIYLHGTNEEHLIGMPYSHGCIRMKNEDMIRLFNLVEPGEAVIIK